MNISNPINMDIKSWAASLVQDFPSDNIPILSDGKKWKEWGNFLIQSNSFSINGAPSTSAYSDWTTWATYVCKTMANS